MLLELSGIEKVFDGFRLNPVSFSIDQGEFFSLIGPSGCGKTTILRIIGGFESPSAGSVRLGDRNITKLPPHGRNIHTVFQRYALFPHLNVFENVAFSLRLKKLPRPEIDERVNELLNLVDLKDFATRRISQLSGGQMQRVALIRALADRPQVLLLDEPLSALDPALRNRMREELRAVCKKVGITFIMVTHDQEEALQISDRLAIMKDGNCLQVGTPKAIYEDPATPFVARFIGPTNEIVGEIEQQTDTDHWHVKSALGKIRIKKNGVELPKRITLVIRPEKMRILRQRSQTQDILVEGEIADLSYLGSRTEYVVRTAQSLFKVFEPELERLKKRSLNPGDRIFLTWRPEDAIILPEEAPGGTSNGSPT